MQHVIKQKGLRKKVTATVTCLVVCSLTLLGLTLSGIIFAAQRHEVLTLQREIVEYAVNEISWDIHELETVFHFAATNYQLSGSAGKKPEDILSQLLSSKDIKRHNIIDDLVYLDKTGRELARVSRTKVFTQADLVDRSREEAFILPAHTGQVYYGPLSFDEVTTEPQMMFSMPVQDIRTQAIKGVLLAKIRLDRIWSNAVIREIGEQGSIFITNSNGRVVAHRDPSIVYRKTIFKEIEGKNIQNGLNGKKVLLTSGIFNLGERTFKIYASLPLSEVLAPSLRTLYITGIFLILFIGTSLLVSFAALRRIVGPIEALADSARKITAGGLVPPPLIESTDEIGDLAIAFNVMTSRLLETIESLEKRNALMNNILNSLTHPFYVIDVDTYRVELANPAAHFGELTGDQKCYSLTHKKDQPCEGREHPCVIKLIKEKKEPVSVKHIHYDPDGLARIMEIHGYPIFDDNGKIAKVIEYNLDVTSREEAQKLLRESEEKYRGVVDNVGVGIALISPGMEVLSLNRKMKEWFPHVDDTVTPVCYRAFNTPPRDDVCTYCPTRITLNDGMIHEAITDTPFGEEIRHFRIISTPLRDERGEIISAIEMVEDITESKQAEEKIRASLKEKEILLREVHHRVKNNMQVISSLLDLQVEYLKDRNPEELFNESKHRIKSMALVHEMLYRSEDLAKVNIYDYLSSMVENLYVFYGVTQDRIPLLLNIENVFMGIDTAIPCGLIINELVTNSLKYAFPDGRKGQIEISLKTLPGTGDERYEYELTVTDDGIGLPGDLDPDKSRTLGLHLVTNLAGHQLQGNYEIEGNHGTRFILRFNELTYGNRI